MKQICSIIHILAIFICLFGDLVYSYDTIAGEVSQKEVTATFVRESDRINYLTIVDENGNVQVLETTDGHPFWVVTDTPDLERAASGYSDGLYHENVGPTEHGFWVEAKDLKVGDVFIGANGELTTLTNIVRVEQSGGINVFNFTVAGNHNYFILAKEYEYGQTCVLVHNAKCHDHHIVMKGDMSGWKPENRKALQESQALLNKYSIGLNHPKNMVKNILSEGHSIKYTQEINKRLQKAANDAIGEGYNKKEIRNAILKALGNIGEKLVKSPKDIFK